MVFMVITIRNPCSVTARAAAVLSGPTVLSPQVFRVKHVFLDAGPIRCPGEWS